MWFKKKEIMFCDECGKNFQLDTEQCALTISTSRYICSDCTQELVKQLNKQEDKVMTRDKILEKVKVNIDRKNKKIEEERQESEYCFQCLSEDVCPECGADVVEKTIELSADQFYDLPISVLNSMPYRQFYDSKFNFMWEVKGHICNSCKTLFGPGCMTKIMPDWVIYDQRATLVFHKED